MGRRISRGLPSRPMADKGAHPVDLVPVALAGWLLWQLCVVWAGRLPYPYDLEWMEGGMLAHAWRLQHGLPLYVEPGPDWVPFLYPPGYPAVLAALGMVFELGAPLGRAVSLSGSLAAAAAIAWIVARRGGSALYGALGGVVFLGTYPDAGGFHDIVRNDGLFLGLIGWSVAMATERGRAAPIVSGLLLFLAFLVKHNGAMLGVPILAGFWLRDGRWPALKFALSSIVPAAAATGALQIATGGLFLTYLLSVPASHVIVGERILPGTPWELGHALPIALLGASAWFAGGVVRGLPEQRRLGATAAIAGAGLLIGLLGVEDLLVPRVSGIPSPGPIASFVGFGAIASGAVAGGIGLLHRRRDGDWVLGAGVCAVVIGLAAMMRGHFGGFVNVHLPMFWGVSLAFALGMARWRRADRGPLVAAVSALAMAAQVAWHMHDFTPARFVPTAEDRAAGDAIVATLRDAEEPILSPFAPWLPVQAGHEPSWHLIALWDVSRHEGSPFPESEKRVVDAMRARHWGTVVDGTKTMAFGLKSGYILDETLPGASGVFVPKTGWRTRPKATLVPKGAADPEGPPPTEAVPAPDAPR